MCSSIGLHGIDVRRVGDYKHGSGHWYKRL